MKQPKKAILLINLGTPDNPSVPDVRRYLDEFLMDGRVMDIPTLRRAFVVKGIIIPCQAAASTKIFKDILDDQTGSQLMYYSISQQQLLQDLLGYGYHVELAIRYQIPSIESSLENLRKMKVDRIRII